MQTNSLGIAVIEHFEDLRLSAYQDAVGVWTIGWGHTRTAKSGMKVTRDEAVELLRLDLREAEAGVERLVTVPLSSNQFSALASFTFNLGVGNLASSTLLKRLNRRDYSGAEEEFHSWRKAGGKVLKGLERRRAVEAFLFALPDLVPAKMNIEVGPLHENLEALQKAPQGSHIILIAPEVQVAPADA